MFDYYLNPKESPDEFMRKEMQTQKPCILCGKSTHNRGIFFPENSQEFGASTGKQRVLIYPLCESHPQNQATLDQVEKHLLSQTKGKTQRRPKRGI